MQRVLWRAQEYFVYFKPSKVRDAAKEPLSSGGLYLSVCPYKKGAGRIAIRPAWTPVSL